MSGNFRIQYIGHTGSTRMQNFSDNPQKYFLLGAVNIFRNAGGGGGGGGREFPKIALRKMLTAPNCFSFRCNITKLR